MIGQGPASITVTGTIFPSCENKRVTPSFFPMISLTISAAYPWFNISIMVLGYELQLYFHVDPGCQIQFHQGIHRLLGRVQDIEEPFVSSNLKLFPRFLVDMRGSQHGEALDMGGQRDRARDVRPGSLRRVHDLGC